MNIIAMPSINYRCWTLQKLGYPQAQNNEKISQGKMDTIKDRGGLTPADFYPADSINVITSHNPLKQKGLSQ